MRRRNEPSGVLAGVLARLGNVIHWTGCTIAALAGLWVVLALLSAGPDDDRALITMFGAAVGGVCWAIGRICLYILAGR